MAVKFAPGTSVYADAPMQDGRGFAAHPCIVIQEEDDRVQVIIGSSQKATEGALKAGEFLVSDEAEREALGLSSLPSGKKATRYSFNRHSMVWMPKDLVKEVIGSAPKSVLARMFKAAVAAGVIKP